MRGAIDGLLHAIQARLDRIEIGNCWGQPGVPAERPPELAARKCARQLLAALRGMTKMQKS